MMTQRQFAYAVATLYSVVVFLFVTTAAVPLALGTGAAWLAALNLAALAETTADMTSLERMLYIKFGIK